MVNLILFFNIFSQGQLALIKRESFILLMGANIVIDFVEGARLIGAGLATIGLTGAGVGIVLFL